MEEWRKKNCLVILIYARATSKQSVNMKIKPTQYAHGSDCVRINVKMNDKQQQQ